MKKIKIFLGSSITEFEKERNDLELFIRNVSDEFEEKYNIKLFPLRCENMDNHIRVNGTQDSINKDLVQGSDMCFFIFFTKAGEFTEQEFEVAFEKFKKDGKPKIYIYFHNIPDGQTVEESLHIFITKIDNVFKHYHGSFDHIDTIKLRILLNLKIQEMDFLSVELKNGKCVVDGKETLDLSNVSEFSNNKILQQLKEELYKTERDYTEMQLKVKSGDADESYYKAYAEIASKRANLMDSIDELQKSIFDISLKICEDDIHGKITIRQQKAYRLFELGDYEGAIKMLNSEDIDNDFFKFKNLEEEKLRKKAQIYVREHMTAIDILETMFDYKERFQEIEHRFEKVSKVVQKYQIEVPALLQYGFYINDHGNERKAIEILEIARSIDEENDVLSHFYRTLLYAGLLELHSEYTDTKIIKKYADKYFSLLDEESNPNHPFFLSIKASYYLRFDDYKSALRLYRQIINNKDTDNEQLAECYYNLYEIYKLYLSADADAEYYLNKSIELSLALAKECRNKTRVSSLAHCYYAAFTFYKDNPELRDKYYGKSLTIYEKLVEIDPLEYSKILALLLFKHGKETNNKEELEKAYKLLKIYPNDSFGATLSRIVHYENHNIWCKFERLEKQLKARADKLCKKIWSTLFFR